jgi:microcystin-dependent protein
MSDYYVGEIRLFAFNQYVTADFLACEGQMLSISQYQTLYSVIGTTYGGDGVNTFKVPDLRGRSPVAIGQPVGSPNTYNLGQAVGVETVTLTESQIPAHSHTVSAATVPATGMTPSPSVVQAKVPDGSFLYCNATQAGTDLNFAANAVIANYGGQPHDNMQPTIVLQYAICVNGLYPQFN